MAMTDEERRAADRERKRKAKEKQQKENPEGDVIASFDISEAETEIVDPVGPEDNGPVSGRKRGRPKGRSRSSGENKLNAKGLEAILLSIHVGLATILKVPELMLDKSEAEEIGKAAEHVASFYDLPELPVKAMAWGNLAIVCVTVYGTRFAAYNMRVSQERAERQASNGVVIDGVPVP